jgi:hypothetical protein
MADDHAALERKFRKAAARGKVTIMAPLPWRTRLRLWRERVINRAGIWLCDHGHDRAAVALWRACRMW